MADHEENIMSWGLVNITRPRSSGRPVNGHVVQQRPSIEIDYEKARHLVHQTLNLSGGITVGNEPCVNAAIVKL